MGFGHSSDRATVYIVEPDHNVRASLQELLRINGYWALGLSSAESLLHQLVDAEVPCCLITEVQLPGMTGLELQRRIAASRTWLPTIFLTNCSQTEIVVRAMKGAAIDYLLKPYASRQLLQSIEAALRVSRTRSKCETLSRQTRERLAQLTPREREVAELLVQGLSTKEVASSLQISGKTVFVHRAHALAKMEVESIVQLSNLLAGCDPLSTAPLLHQA